MKSLRPYLVGRGLVFEIAGDEMPARRLDVGQHRLGAVEVPGAPAVMSNKVGAFTRQYAGRNRTDSL